MKLCRRSFFPWCCVASFILVLTGGCTPHVTAFPDEKLILSADGSSTEGGLAGMIFGVDDREISACLEVGAATGEVVEWVWIAPGGKVYASEKRKLFRETECSRISLPAAVEGSYAGEWHLSVLLNGKSAARRTFYRVADKDRWKAENVGDLHLRGETLRRLCEKKDYEFLARYFNLERWPYEQTIIRECLTVDSTAAAPVVASLIEQNPTNEDLLLVAYKMKLDLAGKLRIADRLQKHELVAYIQLLRDWDAGLTATLLESKLPELRLEAVRVLRESNSALVPLLLRDALDDESPEVRLAVADALGSFPGSISRNALKVRLQEETSKEVSTRIAEILAARNSEY